VRVYDDVSGRLVRTLVNGVLQLVIIIRSRRQYS